MIKATRNVILMCGLALGLSVSTAACGAAPQNTKTYRYVYLNDGGQVIISEDANSVSSSEDNWKATFCDAASGYFCIRAGAFLQFAVPRDLKPSQEKWSFQGESYQVVNKLTGMYLLDKYVQFMVIRGDAPQTHQLTYFYYSPKDGLIGWAFTVDAPPDLIVIMSWGGVRFGQHQEAGD